MKSRCLFALAVFIWPVLMAAQQLMPGKSIAFTQIAAGGGYTSVINLTNRCTATYNGTLNLFTGSGQPWSPAINGTPISNGSWPVTIATGATVTLTITVNGPNAAAGFGVISTTDNSFTNCVEGTLTYYVKSGTGAVLDSVGIAPANEIYLTTIPFDDFNTIAVALANLNPFGVMAKMTVFSDTGQVVGTFTEPLPSMWHVPKYLSQFFPGVSLTRGRLEIQCDSLIIGEALTIVQNQLSSLPFLPALKTFTWTITNPPQYGGASSGTGSMWINGSSITGYAVPQGGGSSSSFAGKVSPQGSSNSLVFYGNGQSGSLTYVQYFSFPSFTFSAPTAAGTVTTVTLDGTIVVPGTMTITATN
jgi:hypothetical protein